MNGSRSIEGMFHMEQSAGTQLQAMRRRVEHRCEGCGKAFQAITKARYCSDRCRSAAYRVRKASITEHNAPESPEKCVEKRFKTG